jgi:hypothetical protein
MEFTLTKPLLGLLLAAMDSERKKDYRGRPFHLRQLFVGENRAIATDTQVVAVITLGEADEINIPPMLIDGPMIRELSVKTKSLLVSYDGKSRFVLVAQSPTTPGNPDAGKVAIGNASAFPLWSIDDYLKKTPRVGTASAAELKKVLGKEDFNNDTIKAKPGYFHILFSDSSDELLWRNKATGREKHLLDLKRTGKRNTDIFLNPQQVKSVFRPAGLWTNDSGVIGVGIKNRIAAKFEVPGIQVLLSGFPNLDGRGVLVL